ncbi:Myosin heavy chain [Lasiodiplodia theobromae]|uniref:Myosin heavy chain n=1 Tax=Lasiodiplodia theobromae TaxID=45133 RepID=A0A5N5CZI2_9PEZI|nr:Myosin heavy chain [Lasiodiplodia theobromae]
MPSPEAGEGNDAEGFKVVSSNEFDDAIFDLDFTFAAEMARKFSQDTSPSTHSQQHPQRPVSGEVHESSRIMTVPLKSDDAPSAIIKRPRSSGEPPSQGFKFVKATGRQLDMTRKRSSKTQASEIPEPRTTKKQGHTGKNENGQEPLVRKEGGREQPNASELQEPINSFSGIQKVQLEELPLQPDHTVKLPFNAAQTDLYNTHPNQTESQQDPHVSSKPISYSAPFGGISTEEQGTKRARPPTADNSAKPDQDKPLSACGTLDPAPPISRIGNKKAKRTFREEHHLAGSLRASPLAEGDNIPGPPTTSGSGISQVHPQSPHNRVDRHTRQDDNAMVDGNARQEGNEGEEQNTDAYLQVEHQANPEQRDKVGEHLQRSPDVKQQTSHKAPSAGRAFRGPRLPESEPKSQEQLHNLNSRAAPTKVTKTGVGAKRAQGSTKTAKNNGRAGEPANPPRMGSEIHSSHVLGIWQKLFEQEQKQLTAREVARRENCEAELARLRLAEQEHDSALKAAKKARLTASTKLQQLQNANQELGARIQELEASLTSASQEVKELQHDKKTAAKAYAKTEKRIALLEAEKESLAVSKDADQQQASQKVAELELELSETQKDFKNAKQVIKMLEKDLSQKVGDLAEQKDRMAEFVKDKQDTLSKYSIIEEIINNLGSSLSETLAGITQSTGRILEGQATKDSVDGILENVRTIHSVLSGQNNEVGALRGVVQYLNDSVQSKLDGLKESEELSRRNNGVFEQRLFDRFHEEFKTYAPSQEDLVEARKENAALEERCALLQESVTEMRKKLDEAASTKEATQRNHTEVLTELSRLRDSLTSVDSTRLQQLEASKAVVDQELRNALIRIDAEERKFRSLSETQLALRQEVVGLKEQLINAKETISKAHSNNSQDSTDISQLIEAERENARLYYSKHSRDVVQQNQAKHANELHTEQEKTRQANESLRSQSAQIASLKEQIRQKDLELQSLGESSPVGSATVDDLQRQLDAARTENTEVRISMQIQSDRELNEIQVRLNDLQVQKRESDLRCKQAEENNATVQGQLQASNNKFAELQQQLEAARNLVKEYDQEAEKQKSDAEEWLHLREEQWAAEAEGIRSQLEAANSQMQENEASTQLRFEEYEEQLRNYRRLRENTKSERQIDMDEHLALQTGNVVRPPTATSANTLRSPAPEVMIPAANSGSVRKPRRKLRRSNKSTDQTIDETQPEKSLLLRNPPSFQGDSQPGPERSHIRATQPSSDGSSFGEDFWVSQELGKQERLTEQGVMSLPPHRQKVAENLETIQDLLRTPKRFSQFDKEHDSHEERSSSSGLSSVPSTDLEIPDSLFPPQLDQDDVATSSPTSRLRDRDSTARQTNPSIENPFFEEERPVSRANTGKRMESSYQLRQGSHQPDSAVVDESLPRTPFNSRGTARAQSSQRDSPLFMDPPNARNQVTYSHHHTTQPTHVSQSIYSTPSGASKRRASGQDETYSSKRVKGGPTNYRSSPIMTRAVSRGAVSHSQVPESQSQDLHVRFPEESGEAAVDVESQPQETPQKPLQPQSQQQSARAPSVSRMRTSEASSSNAVRNSPPKGGRRRKTEEIGGRFDQEIKSSR